MVKILSLNTIFNYRQKRILGLWFGTTRWGGQFTWKWKSKCLASKCLLAIQRQWNRAEFVKTAFARFLLAYGPSSDYSFLWWKLSSWNRSSIYILSDSWGKLYSFVNQAFLSQNRACPEFRTSLRLHPFPTLPSTPAHPSPLLPRSFLSVYRLWLLRIKCFPHY